MEINAQQPEQEVLDNSKFSINTWFNNLPIRIIGSPVEPFFYASDIISVLGLKNITASIKNFDNNEIVIPETRDRYNIITYKKYKNDFRRDDSVKLLTEFGVYRLIMKSRSALARDFKLHLYEVIRDARLKESASLATIKQEDLVTLHAKMDELKSNVDKYQKYNPAIYVFSIAVNGNPRKYILREDLDLDITDCEYCEQLYKFTTKPSAKDYAKYNLVKEIYGNSEEIMEQLNEHCLPCSKFSEYYRYIADFDDIDCDMPEYRDVYV